MADCQLISTFLKEIVSVTILFTVVPVWLNGKIKALISLDIKNNLYTWTVNNVTEESPFPPLRKNSITNLLFFLDGFPKSANQPASQSAS